MALDKTSLENTLKALFKGGSNDADTMAKGIANAIDAFVKSGTVISNGTTDAHTPGASASIKNLQGTIK